MAVTNNEIGKTWTLYVLGQLSEAWPRGVDFNALDLTTKTAVGPQLDGEVDDVFYDLFRWLRDEGFVSFTQDGDGWAADVQLTSKAMDAIGHALPTEKSGVGNHLKKLAAGSGSEAGKAAIAETVGLLIGAAARGLSGANG